MTAWKLVICATAVAVVLPANEFSVGSQPPAFWFDEQSRSIRPLVGPAGGARLDEAVISEADFASISPNGLAAIVRRGQEWSWIDDLRGVRNSLTFEMPPGPLTIRWAGQAPCAAVYSGSAVAVWSLCFSNATVNISGPLYLGAGFTGLDSMDLNGDGSSLLCIASSEAGAALLYTRNLSGWIAVAQLPEGGMAVFRRDAPSLLVADRARGVLSEISIRFGWPAWAVRTIALAETEGAITAILEGGSKDLMAVLDEGQRVSLYSLQDGFGGSRPLDSSVSRPIPLGLGRYLAAPIDPRGSLQFFDLNREEVVFFVPQTR